MTRSELSPRAARIYDELANQLDRFATVSDDNDRYFRAFLLCSTMNAALGVCDDLVNPDEVTVDYLAAIKLHLSEDHHHSSRVER